MNWLLFLTKTEKIEAIVCTYERQKDYLHSWTVQKHLSPYSVTETLSMAYCQCAWLSLSQRNHICTGCLFKTHHSNPSWPWLWIMIVEKQKAGVVEVREWIAESTKHVTVNKEMHASTVSSLWPIAMMTIIQFTYIAPYTASTLIYMYLLKYD